MPGVLKGKVIQALRSHAINQNINGQDQSNDGYFGKIQVITDSANGKKDEIFLFGMFSLSDKKITLQLGDIVSFQSVETPFDSASKKKAFNILLIQQAQTDQQLTTSSDKQTDKSSRLRDLKKGKVESIKGHVRKKIRKKIFYK